jgi:hypothetical protein
MIIRSLIAAILAASAMPALAHEPATDAAPATKPVKVASAGDCRVVKWHPTPPGKPNSYILRSRQVGDCSGATALNDKRPDGAAQASE